MYVFGQNSVRFFVDPIPNIFWLAQATMTTRKIIRPLISAAVPSAPKRSIFAGQDAWRKHPMIT
jgi:hypothetical protein